MQNSQYSECFPGNLDKVVTSVVKLLERRGLTVATAESCTGGLLSELITSVTGASAVFELGLCTYSEKMKSRFLGVSEEEIAQYGVVSREVALSMVRGLKQCSDADVCISVTGIAGPGGGTAETPVGTVYIGFDICGKQFVMLPELWKLPDKSRDRIRFAAAEFAFGIVEEMLMEAVQTNE
ncbi:MAG: CinA family protein [Ruminococcus sp.]|nr:CinA family protein [Ruminococcus sp.]